MCPPERSLRLGPEKSKLRIFLLALVFMSLTCAIAAPVGIDLLDSRIYTPQDVEKMIGFHPLGVLVDDDEFRQEISDEYYFRLAAGVDHAVRNSGCRTFLFTSPTHGGGTTTVVRKLNEELRGLNLRTLMITASGSGDLDFSQSDVPSRSSHLLESRNKTDEIQPSPLSPLCHLRFRWRRPNGENNPLLIKSCVLSSKPASFAMWCSSMQSRCLFPRKLNI